MFGPGKYDEIAKRIREELNAEGVILGVFNGRHGHGFSMEATMEAAAKIPDCLRMIAAQMEKDMRDGPDVQKMYVIYDHPSDYPQSFVVRVWERCGAQFNPTSTCFEADTLEAARALVPAGANKIARQAADDPKISEVWI